MDDSRRKQIYSNLNLKDTEELLEIWRKKNTDEWQPGVFEIIEQILIDRLGSEFIQSVQTEPDQTLGKVYAALRTQTFVQASKESKTSIQNSSDLAATYTSRGLIYDELGQNEEALAAYREAIHLDPEMEDALFYLTSLEREIEEEFQNSTAKLHLDQALAYALDEEPERALEECALAKNELPDISFVYNYLGLILEELKQLEPAIEAYQEAIRCNPRFYPSRENLANASIKLEEGRYHHASQLDWAGSDGNDSPPFIDEEIPWDDTESQAANLPDNDVSVPGWLYLDENSFLLAGWPGHRLRPGRSGYDPVDTYCEEGHMEGVMLRLLFTGRLRTHNPIFLLLLTFIGSVFSLPLFFVLGTGFQDYLPLISIFLIYSPLWLTGIAILINGFSSLINKKPEIARNNGSTFF